MSLKAELASKADEIFGDNWKVTEGRVVPEPSALGLGNEAVHLEAATVLYADISGSTKLVDERPWTFAAEIYKAFLYCAARLVRSEGGTITAYDGDRLMAVYIGDSKNSSAVRTALKINYVSQEVIMPALKTRYPKSLYQLRHVVGCDTSQLRAARTGVRGDNDLVWVGRAANYAAKLTELSHDFPSWITGEVHDVMIEEVKTSNGKRMWEERVWTAMNGLRIYRSNWRYKVS